MKKLLLALVALGAITALCVIGTLAYLGDGEETAASTPPPVDPRAATATAGAKEIVAPQTPADGAGPAGAGARTESNAAPRAGERFGAWDEGEEIEIRGRVALPAGMATDPSLRILALDRPLSPAELYGESGVATALGRRDRSQVSPHLLAVESVEPDGSFRVPFPARVKRGWLALDGRYLYSSQPEEVRRPETGEEVVIVPRVGGCVAGRLLLPPATAEPATHYGHAVAELVPDTSTFSMARMEGGWMFGRKVEVEADGSFAFRAVDTGRAYEAVVECEGFATFVQPSFALEPGRDYPLEARLGEGVALRGRVIDEEGRPVAEVDVQARKPILWGIPAGPRFASATTDAEGRFELPHVPAGRIVLTTRHAAYLENAPEVLELGGESFREGIELRISRGATISGTVRWEDGDPAAGVGIEVQFDPAAMMGPGAFNAARGGDGKATTDEDGAFTVAGLGKGPFQLTARGKRGAGTEAEKNGRVQRGGIRPGTEDLELVLASPPLLLGRVVDEAGEPVTAFRVQADSGGAVMFVMGEARHQEFANEEGRFAMEDLFEGPWEITVFAEGYAPSAPQTVDVPRPPEAEPLLVVLRPPAGVRGFVTDASGLGVEGARVTVEVEPSKTMARLAGRMKVPETRSGEDGAFLLEGLTAGEVAIVATHPDYASSEPLTVTVEAGAVADRVHLVLRQGGTLSGEVFGKDGEPAGGTTLIVQNPSTFEPTITTTDAGGEFRLEKLDPGSYTVTAMLAGLMAETGEDEDGAGALAGLMNNIVFTAAEVRDGEETHVVLGAPPADPVRVHGKVTHAGDPAPGLMLTFMPEGAQGFGGMKTTQSDGEGRYETVLDGPGEVLVTVASFRSEGGMQQISVEYSCRIPAGEEHRLDFELPAAKISGTVRGPDGDPLSEARITLTADGGIAYGTLWGGQYAETTTDAGGRYELPYLRPGTYSVAAGGALMGGFLGTKKGEGRQVRSGLAVREGQHLDGIDFRLETPGDITGTVVDAAGKPVAGVAIFVRDVDGRLLERFSMNQSGPDGKFRYPGVAPGRYTITARGQGLASVEGDSLRVQTGETTDVTVHMTAGTMLLVQVLDRSGDRVRARVSVRDDQGREVNGMLSFSDLMQNQGGITFTHQRVGPLPPGRYVVTAVADDGRTVAKPVHLTGQAERKLKVRLK